MHHDCYNVMWNWGCGVQEILSAWPGSAVTSWQLLADHEVFRLFTLETVKMEYDMTERIALIERHQRYLSYIILSYTHVNLQSHSLETSTFHSRTNPITGLYISHRSGVSDTESWTTLPFFLPNVLVSTRPEYANLPSGLCVRGACLRGSWSRHTLAPTI